jgi:hypothetical protein
MDHHVPAAITEGLRRRAVDVVTAKEDGSDRLEDDQHLERAANLGRVLFSQDEDLLAITHQWLKDGREFAGLVYAHQLNISIGKAIRDLELITNVFNLEDMRNRIEFIPY